MWKGAFSLDFDRSRQHRARVSRSGFEKMRLRKIWQSHVRKSTVALKIRTSPWWERGGGSLEKFVPIHPKSPLLVRDNTMDELTNEFGGLSTNAAEWRPATLQQQTTSDLNATTVKEFVPGRDWTAVENGETL